MRKSVKLAAALLLGAFGAAANAHIEFIQAKMLSLDRLDDRWVLEMEIHLWENGGRRVEAPPRRVSMQLQRVPRCIFTKRLYLGSEEEFEQALAVLRAQVASGGVHRFGLNADQVSPKGDAYLAVNLRVFKPGQADQLVWAIGSEGGRDHCPFKFLRIDRGKNRE
jgi:hypothetical protein